MKCRVAKQPQKLHHIFIGIVVIAILLLIVQQYGLPQDLPSYIVDDGDNHKHKKSTIFDNRNSKIYITDDELKTPTQSMCTHWNCMDAYKCIEDGLGKISVYVYDLAQHVDKHNQHLLPSPSKEYVHILWAITNSRYFVNDHRKACVLVPSVDLLNRENYSGDNAAKVLASLPFWNNGTNHLIFNMISGVAPLYLSTLDFAHGKAMLTGSGFTQRSYRRTFDIAIPLFNPHQKPGDFVHRNNQHRSIFMIASQQTFYQSLYNQLLDHVAKRPDIVLLTRCDQGRGRKTRCDPAGKSYPYPAVLTQSKFCLITRERQLASTYLHDILRARCVPVISMDVYVMPFSEVLDWRRAAVFVNEKRLDELTTILTDLLEDGNAYSHLQEQGSFYYKKYFKSLDKIALTTLDILNDRVLPYRAKTYDYWNGPLVANRPASPFFVPLIPSQVQGFTAIVLTYDRFELMKRVVTTIATTKGLAKIIVIWNNPQVHPPEASRWPVVSVPIKVC